LQDGGPGKPIVTQSKKPETPESGSQKLQPPVWDQRPESLGMAASASPWIQGPKDLDSDIQGQQQEKTHLL
jgi:hypothetical protein